MFVIYILIKVEINLLNNVNLTDCFTSTLNRRGIFVAIANNTLFGSELSIFLLCQKSLGYYILIISKDHVPWSYFVNFTVNISVLNFLVISWLYMHC